MIGMSVAGFGTSLISGCQALKSVSGPGDAPPIDPLLSARVTAPKAAAATGTTVPFSNPNQEAFLYLPPSYKPSTPTPLVLMLHGEGSTSYSTLQLFQPHADAAGLALLAVDSERTTWDIMSSGFYGPDVDFINSALLATFNEVNVDPARIAIEGYSSGATYALAMGRTNGDLFSHVISFSAGGTEPYTPKGMPKFFLSQGLSDQVYDITQTGRVLSQNLISAGYSVDYVEFDGGHELPDAIVQQAIAWLAT
jgi:phospholipase/carboxylesterase